MEKCSHLLSDRVLSCASCHRNCSGLHHRLIAVLEESELIRNAVVMFDSYTQVGLWASNFVLKLIADQCPGVNIVTVAIKPYSLASGSSCARGSEVFLSLLSAINAFTRSTAVSFRGFSDILCNVSSAEVAGPEDSSTATSMTMSLEKGVTLEEAQRAVACDLFMAFTNNSLIGRVHKLWPMDVIDTSNERCKIFDVRTSLYKYLTQTKVARKANDGAK